MDEIMMRTSKYDEQEMENYKVRGWKIVGCRSRDKRGWMSQQGWMVFPTTMPPPSPSNIFNSIFFRPSLRATIYNHILYFLTFPFSVAPFCIDFPFPFFCDFQNNALNLSPHFFSAQRKKSFGKIGNLKAPQCEKTFLTKQDLTRYAKTHQTSD